MAQDTARILARQVYRHLLQSAKLAFEGDSRVLTESRAEIRRQFELNRSLRDDDSELKQKIQHGDEVAKYLRENVVQGRLVENEGKEEGEKYKLKIHKYTERRDNGAWDTDFIKPGVGCGGGRAKKAEAQMK